MSNPKSQIIHVGKSLPSWIKSIVPSDALKIEEKAWNSYPKTKTEYNIPFLGAPSAERYRGQLYQYSIAGDRFSIKIATHFYDDPGDIENCFELNKADLKIRQVDFIDIGAKPLTFFGPLLSFHCLCQ